MTGSGCSRCGHPAHDTPCRTLGPVTCRPVGGARVRGRFPCNCPGEPARPPQVPRKTCPCGQELVMAVTATGAQMPVEAGSAGAADGTLTVWLAAPGVLGCRVLKRGEEPGDGEWRGRTHWGRCPAESRFRKPDRSVASE